jgi:hypothetical protein
MDCDSAPLIVTLEMDQPTFALFDAERRRSFPTERNFIPAHITLFHRLPGLEGPSIARDLRRAASLQRPITLDVTGLRLLGRGVAYAIESVEADHLRRSLADLWDPWLVPQDRGRPRLHVTVQNKVEPGAARALHDALTRTFVPFRFIGTGLHLWAYQGGPWASVDLFPFGEAGT